MSLTKTKPFNRAALLVLALSAVMFAAACEPEGNSNPPNAAAPVPVSSPLAGANTTTTPAASASPVASPSPAVSPKTKTPGAK